MAANIVEVTVVVPSQGPPNLAVFPIQEIVDITAIFPDGSGNQMAAIDQQMTVTVVLPEEPTPPSLILPFIPVAGPPGPPGSGSIANEIPSGAIDGVNTVFSTAQPFQIPKVSLYLNGIRQRINQDFTLVTESTFLMTEAPLVGDTLNVDYIPQ